LIAHTLPHAPRLPAWLGERRVLLLGLLVIGGSAAIAGLPLTTVIGATLIAAIVIGTLLEPGIGLVVALIAGPWAAWMNTYTPGLLPIDAGQIIIGLTLGAWVLGGLARRRFVIPGSPLLLPLSLFVGWAAITMLWAPDLSFGLPEVIKWIEIILVMLLAIDVAQRRSIQWILTGVLATASLQALIGLYEARWRGTGPLGFRLSEGVYRAYGTFEQPNPFAGFIGMVLPIALAVTAYYALRIGSSLITARLPRRTRYSLPITHYVLRFTLYAFVTLLLAAALYLSFSRGAWLGAIAAVGALMVFAPRRLWIGVALAAAALIALISLSSAGLLPSAINERLADAGTLFDIRDVRGVPINDANYALIERQAHWQAALNMLTAHPWTGVGFSNYQPVYEQYRLLNWPMPLGHAHNIYLNVAAETGIIGLGLYLVLWASVLVVTFRATRQASGFDRAVAVGLMGAWVYLGTHMLVDNLYVNNTHLIIGALLGVLSAIAARAPNPASNFQALTSNI
jgi:putative inorganic carbon (HCO3(-)) transporter